MSNFKLLLIANGPGEISNLVQPVCKALKANFPNITPYLFLVPCQFASGNEKKVAESFEVLQDIFSAEFTFKFSLHLKAKPFECDKGAVLYLGGDPFYAKRVAKRFDIPVYAYAETKGQANFKNVFRRTKDFDLMSDNRMNIDSSKEKLFSKHKIPNASYTLFFASSRNKQFQYLVPYYFECIREIQKIRPDFSAIISCSPFVDSQYIKKFKASCPPNTYLLTDNPKSLFKMTDTLITIPGTNTAEAMYSGKAMLVVLPLIRPEVLDFPGLLGILIQIPVLRNVLLNIALWYFRKKIKLFSIPNILHQSLVVPELVGKVFPEDLAHFILKHLDDPKDLDAQKKLFDKYLKQKPFVGDHILRSILNENHAC